MLSESDSKLYTNFESCEGKYIIIYKLNKNKSIDISKHIDLQSQEMYDGKNIFKKSVHISQDGGSGVEVGDIE